MLFSVSEVSTDGKREMLEISMLQVSYIFIVFAIESSHQTDSTEHIILAIGLNVFWNQS